MVYLTQSPTHHLFIVRVCLFPCSVSYAARGWMIWDFTIRDSTDSAEPRMVKSEENGTAFHKTQFSATQKTCLVKLPSVEPCSERWKTGGNLCPMSRRDRRRKADRSSFT